MTIRPLAVISTKLSH